MNDIEWYIEFVLEELVKYKEAGFIGNVSYRFNFHGGKITNIVAEQHKSIKMQEGG